MSPLDIVLTALQALRVNRMRSGLTTLGIVISVAAVICMLAVGTGARYDVTQKIRTLGANLLLIRPGAQSTGAARLEAGTARTLTADDAIAIRRDVRDVQFAAPLLARPARLIAGDRNSASLVAGITADYLPAREWRIGQGRTFTDDENDTGSKVAIIGTDIVTKLFDGRAALGETLRIDRVPFRVIAILDKKGPGPAGISQDDVVFIPLTAAKSRVLGAVRGGTREALDFIITRIEDRAAMADARADIKALLRRRHRLIGDVPDDFTIQDPTDVLRVREGAVQALGILLMSVAAVSLAVGGISIMNIMLVSVSERTREIGLRMTLGGRRSDIRSQFLTEAIALALVGGLAGCVTGCLAAVMIAWLAGWPVVITPLSILLAFGSAAMAGVTFGLYPAYRASCLDPIVALRSE